MNLLEVLRIEAIDRVAVESERERKGGINEFVILHWEVQIPISVECPVSF